MTSLTAQDISSALRPLVELYTALLAEGDRNPPQEINRVVFDLATERTRTGALEINFPFKSFRVLDATDSNAFIYFLPYSKGDEQGTVGAKYRTNGVYVSRNRPIPRGFFYWDAQTSKQLTIEFYRDSETVPGNFSTSISEVFSGMNAADSVDVEDTATLVKDVNYDRKAINLINMGSDYVYWGTSAVTAATGIPIAPLEKLVIKNTVAIYMISNTGVTNAVRHLEET